MPRPIDKNIAARRARIPPRALNAVTAVGSAALQFRLKDVPRLDAAHAEPTRRAFEENVRHSRQIAATIEGTELGTIPRCLRSKAIRRILVATATNCRSG